MERGEIVVGVSKNRVEMGDYIESEILNGMCGGAC